MKSWPRSFLALLAAGLAFSAFAQDKDNKDKPDDKKASGEEPQSTEDLALQEIPMGAPTEGLRIPQYSPDGKLMSLLDAKTAKRVDAKHIDFTGLKIEIHNSDGTTFHVEMPHAILDLDTRVLTGDSPTQIRREGFVIDGDQAEFFTKTRFGKMTGNVKMVIESEDIK